MHPYRDKIVRRGAPPGGGGHDVRPLAVIRDGPVVEAVCPHCGGGVALSPVGSSWQTNRPIEVAARLVPQLGPLEREELHVLVLNAKNGVIAQDRVYQGNVSASLVRVGELFKGAVERHGSGLILCHNHPSGDPAPSPDDLHLTAEAIAAGRLLDIPVVDHIIIGGGRFVSLRDVGVSFEVRANRHAAEEGGGPAWRNPRRGAWKSALQKHVRRGEVEAAAEAAQALVSLPGGRGALARRLPVITAEDVGIAWLPAVVSAVRGPSRNEPASPDRLVTTAASLAALPKSKEAFWLAANVWNGRHEAPEVSTSGLERALRTDGYQDALAISLQAVEDRNWRSGLRLIDVLRADDVPAPAAAIITAALDAERQRPGTGELLAAAIIARIDRSRDHPLELPPATVRRLAPPERPAWYAFDGHTDVGRTALGRVARRIGVEAGRLRLLMWVYESSRLEPPESAARWREAAQAWDVGLGGWADHEEGARIWEALRDLVRSQIEAELRRAW